MCSTEEYNKIYKELNNMCGKYSMDENNLGEKYLRKYGMLTVEIL